MDTSRESKEHPGVEFIELLGPVVIFPNVTIGEGSVVYGPCVLGQPPRHRSPGELPLVIGTNAVIRSSAIIYAGVRIGDNFETGHGILVREDNVLGDDCSVGTYCVLETGNRVGNWVRWHTLSGGGCTTIEDDVSIGGRVSFLTDPHPPCPHGPECAGGATVKTHVKIGVAATIMPGITIGEGALVGSGAVVTRNVPDEVVVSGHPARVVCGVDDLICWPGFYEYPYAWEKTEAENDISCYRQHRDDILRRVRQKMEAEYGGSE